MKVSNFILPLLASGAAAQNASVASDIRNSTATTATALVPTTLIKASSTAPRRAMSTASISNSTADNVACMSNNKYRIAEGVGGLLLGLAGAGIGYGIGAAFDDEQLPLAAAMGGCGIIGGLFAGKKIVDDARGNMPRCSSASGN